MIRLLALISSLLLISFSALAGKISYEKSWKGVRSQGALGSCHAFSAVALLEAEWASEHNKKVDFSEAAIFTRHVFGDNEQSVNNSLQEIFSTNKLFQHVDDKSAGRTRESFEIAKRSGLVLEKDFPYDFMEDELLDLDWQASNDSNFKTTFKKIVEQWLAVPTISQDWIQKLSYRHFGRNSYPRDHLLDILKYTIKCRPVAISVSANVWETSYNHGVVVAGYDDKKKVFIVRNSWGRASVLRKHERIKESTVLENILAVGYLENPSQDCLHKD